MKQLEKHIVEVIYCDWCYQTIQGNFSTITLEDNHILHFHHNNPRDKSCIEQYRDITKKRIEQPKKIIMDLRIKAASFILSGDDVEKQLKALDNAEHTIPMEVTIWEKFQFEPLNEILSTIDNLEEMLQEAWDDGFERSN